MCVCVCLVERERFGEGRPVVGHLCDSAISPYHPFTLSICPCSSLFLSISHPLSVTHSPFQSSNFTSSPQGYRKSATKTVSVCVYVCIIFTCEIRLNIKVTFWFSFFLVLALPRHLNISGSEKSLFVRKAHIPKKHVKSYKCTLPHNCMWQLVCIRSEADCKNARALRTLPSPCPLAN